MTPPLGETRIEETPRQLGPEAALSSQALGGGTLGRKNGTG